MLKLFKDINRGQWFSYGDNLGRSLLKTGDTHYIGPGGQTRWSHPHVAVVPKDMVGSPRRSIYDKIEGDPNG